MHVTKKITPFLWYDDAAEQAAELYVSIFPGSRIIDVSGHQDARPGATAPVMSVTFEVGGQELVAFNGGPHFRFNEAISLFVSCESQEEVDDLWAKLTADGGQESQCGWLKDRFGLSWQICPTVLPRLLSDPDPARAKRAMDAMMGMRKLDIAALERAADGA